MKQVKNKIKLILFNNPHIDGHYRLGEGIQKIYKFDNGYGASVIRNKRPGFPEGYSSYTSNEKEWELAIIKFEGEEWHLVFDTPITEDVIGHLLRDDVENILWQIKAL